MDVIFPFFCVRSHAKTPEEAFLKMSCMNLPSQDRDVVRGWSKQRENVSCRKHGDNCRPPCKLFASETSYFLIQLKRHDDTMKFSILSIGALISSASAFTAAVSYDLTM